MTNSLRMLGIARKAGFLEIGEEAVGTAARAKKARLILSAADASANSRHRAVNFSKAGGVPELVVPFTKEELGMALGKGTPAMLTITDIGLASSFLSKLNAESMGKYEELRELFEKKAKRVMERRKKAKADADPISVGKRRTKYEHNG